VLVQLEQSRRTVLRLWQGVISLRASLSSEVLLGLRHTLSESHRRHIQLFCDIKERLGRLSLAMDDQSRPGVSVCLTRVRCVHAVVADNCAFQCSSDSDVQYVVQRQSICSLCCLIRPRAAPFNCYEVLSDQDCRLSVNSPSTRS